MTGLYRTDTEGLDECLRLMFPDLQPDDFRTDGGNVNMPKARTLWAERAQLPTIPPMPPERIAMLWNSLPLETDAQSVVAFVRAIERYHGIASRAPEAWRPIETAPKDGTRILLGRGPRLDEDGETVDAVSVQGFWMDGYGDQPDVMGHDDGWVDMEFHHFHPGRSFGIEHFRYAPDAPTHWMPLPAAPSIERELRDRGGSTVSEGAADNELPGMWQRSDFEGGQDEVRGPDWKRPAGVDSTRGASDGS